MSRALADYLRAAKREDVLGSERPLRTKHDRAGKSGAPLSSRSSADNLKAYAEDAGIERIHIHQTRHTYARIVAEEAGSFQEPPEALDRENQAATRVYVQRITVEAVKGLRVICRKPTMAGTGLMIRYVRLSSGS